MEDLRIRFPHIAEQIFENLDNYDLGVCREVCISWKDFIDSKKFYWIGIVAKYLNYKEKESLRVIFKLSNLATVKNLALTTLDYFQQEFSSKNVALLHLVMMNGNPGNIDLVRRILNENSTGTFPFLKKNKTEDLSLLQGPAG